MRIHLPHDRDWVLENVLEKLYARSNLPGALAYDRFSQTLATALRHHKGHKSELLALALPASWLVNSRADSIVISRWLDESLVPTWRTLFDALTHRHQRANQSDVGAQDAQLHDAAGEILRYGGNVCALSKVLAPFFPEVVPLMDDAAVWLLSGRVECAPEGTEQAGEADFIPMLDAFAYALGQCDSALEAWAAHFALYPLSPGAILDRQLWFDSFGLGYFGAQAIDDGKTYRVVNKSAQTPVAQAPTS